LSRIFSDVEEDAVHVGPDLHRQPVVLFAKLPTAAATAAAAADGEAGRLLLVFHDHAAAPAASGVDFVNLHFGRTVHNNATFFIPVQKIKSHPKFQTKIYLTVIDKRCHL
jgi:hypothetical protein